MDLNELSEAVNQKNEKNEVSNADVLASLVLIQSQISKIEKIIAENQKINQKNYADTADKFAAFDKNISAIPVLTANIITEKTDKIVPQISNATDTFNAAIAALNTSNAAFKTLLQAWIGTMALCIILIIGLVIWR